MERYELLAFVLIFSASCHRHLRRYHSRRFEVVAFFFFFFVRRRGKYSWRSFYGTGAIGGVVIRLERDLARSLAVYLRKKKYEFRMMKNKNKNKNKTWWW